MVKKILLNNKEYTFTEKDLPILIHGAPHAGSSLFTITLTSQFAQQGNKLLFFSGYDAAKDEFKEQIGNIDFTKVKIVTTGEETDLLNTVKETQDVHERIVLLKNIDLLSQKILPVIQNFNKMIISGDVDTCSFNKKLLTISYKTIILFSPLNNSDKIFPDNFQKYEGYMWGKENGIVKIEFP